MGLKDAGLLWKFPIPNEGGCVFCVVCDATCCAVKGGRDPAVQLAPVTVVGREILFKICPAGADCCMILIGGTMPLLLKFSPGRVVGKGFPWGKIVWFPETELDGIALF